MAGWVPQHGEWRTPDGAAIARSIESHEIPLRNKPANIEPIREELYGCMWDDAGILRDAHGLKRAQSRLHELQVELARSGVPGDDRGFNVSWHDWLNLRSLVEVSQAITAAALAREDSRGAHFREDFPQAGELDASRYTVVRRQGDALSITTEPVRFTRVQPGQSLLQ
jgi:fumarate reductase flavoprotein subunit